MLTPAEADAILVDKQDWLSLTDDIKELHIKKAYVYVKSKWDCPNIDIDAAPEEFNEAIAYYAYADMVGSLFSYDPKVKRKYGKVGDLEEEVEWVSGSKNQDTASFLVYPDALLSFLCTKRCAGVNLTRV